VLGSAPPAAEEAALAPPPPPPAVEVAVAVTVTVAADAEAVLMFTLRPAAMLLRHAETWFWSTPRSCARPETFSCWLLALYCAVAAAWIWSQSTYCTLPPTAFACAKAGAAAARAMAITAANNITFLILVSPLGRVLLYLSEMMLVYATLPPLLGLRRRPSFSSDLRGAVQPNYALHRNTSSHTFTSPLQRQWGLFAASDLHLWGMLVTIAPYMALSKKCGATRTLPLPPLPWRRGDGCA
jgi:hypothetical protein